MLSNLADFVAVLSLLNIAVAAGSHANPHHARSGLAAHPPAHLSFKRAPSVFDRNAVVNMTLLSVGTDRVRHKYAHHKLNHAAFLAKADFHKRSESVLQKARELEARHKALMKRGTIALADNFAHGEDLSYYGPAELGTPGQDFDFIFDTGSADIWVLDETVKSKHDKFKKSQSSTLKTSSMEWSVEYVTGDMYGKLAQDTATAGGYTVEDQVFALASGTSSIFENMPSDAIWGMGFSSISYSGAPTFMENLVQQGQLAQPLFSIYLQRGGDKGVDLNHGGSLVIGGTDSSKYTGAITYAPVTDQGYWEVTCDNVAINGKPVANTRMNAAIDSGTTLAYVPTKVANAIYASLGGQKGSDGHWTVPCDSVQTFGFTFAGRTFLISLDDLFLGLASAGSDRCVVGIIPQDIQDIDGNAIAILGDVLLKSIYTVYSYSHNGKPAVGFAESVTSDTDATGPSSSSGGKNGTSSTSNGGYKGDVVAQAPTTLEVHHLPTSQVLSTSFHVVVNTAPVSKPTSASSNTAPALFTPAAAAANAVDPNAPAAQSTSASARLILSGSSLLALLAGFAAVFVL